MGYPLADNATIRQLLDSCSDAWAEELITAMLWSFDDDGEEHTPERHYLSQKYALDEMANETLNN